MNGFCLVFAVIGQISSSFAQACLCVIIKPLRNYAWPINLAFKTHWVYLLQNLWADIVPWLPMVMSYSKLLEADLASLHWFQRAVTQFNRWHFGEKGAELRILWQGFGDNYTNSAWRAEHFEVWKPSQTIQLLCFINSHYCGMFVLTFKPI